MHAIIFQICHPMSVDYHKWPLKTKDCQFDNFVVTGCTISCHNDNLRCHQSRQSCQIDNLLFSVTSQERYGISNHQQGFRKSFSAWGLNFKYFSARFNFEIVGHIYIRILSIKTNMCNIDTHQDWNYENQTRKKLEQLECLRSEDTPTASW